MAKFSVIFLVCWLALLQASCAGRSGEDYLKISEDSAPGQVDNARLAGTPIATASDNTGIVSKQAVNIKGDAIAGKQIYYRCMGCHSLDRNRTGPAHCGLFGREAGTAKGFEYSTAMKDSSIIWSAKSLDEFLIAPFDVVPGTTMGFAGVKKLKDRQDLIAYLTAAMNSAECQ